jgi:hypothetical protein
LQKHSLSTHTSYVAVFTNMVITCRRYYDRTEGTY